MIAYHRRFILVQGHIIVLIGLIHQRKELKESDENFPPAHRWLKVCPILSWVLLSPFLAFLFWNMIIVVFEFSGDFCSILHAVKGFFQVLLLGSLWSCDVNHAAVFPRHYSHHFLLHLFGFCPVYVGGGCIEDVRGNLVEWQSGGMSGNHTAEKRASTTSKEKRTVCPGLCIFFST